MIEIEKGIPRPQDIRGWEKYPWDRMEIDDSFFVPCKGRRFYKVANSVSHCKRNFEKRNPGRKFTYCRVPTGVRVWRIA
jgi:hypothetical protein